MMLKFINVRLLTVLLLLSALLSTCAQGMTGYYINSMTNYNVLIPTADCFVKDMIVDDGDGPEKGSLQWFVCPGIDCGELQWQK